MDVGGAGARVMPPGRGRELAELILALFERNGLGPGSRLPTERQLAADLGITRTGVRHALAALEADGRISREVGRGTFLRAGSGPGGRRAPRAAGAAVGHRLRPGRRDDDPPPARAAGHAARGDLGDGPRLRRDGALPGGRRRRPPASRSSRPGTWRCTGASSARRTARCSPRSTARSSRPATARSGATSSAAARQASAVSCTRKTTAPSSPRCGRGTQTRPSRRCASTCPASPSTCSALAASRPGAPPVPGL